MNHSKSWHVDRIELQNFRCFESSSFDFDAHLNVLVGVNGAGKTAILDSIAIMLSTILREFGSKTRGFTQSDAHLVAHDLYSSNAVAQLEGRYPISAKISATVAGYELWWRRDRSSPNGKTTWGEKSTKVGDVAKTVWETSRAGVSSEKAYSEVLPVIALYGVDRTHSRRNGGALSISRESAYEATLDGSSDLSRLLAYIKALTLQDFGSRSVDGESANASRAQLKAISLATNTILEGTGWRNPLWNPMVDELTLEHEVHGVQPLSFLSSGIRITAGLAIDLASRAARANPTLGAGQLLKLTPGVVMIDEVDLHLHPSWQQKIVTQLRETFPRMQFIVTTHSPQVLSTVNAENIRMLTPEGNRTPEYSRGLRSDVVLETILGTSAEPSLDINRELDEYISLVDSGEGRSKKATKLRASIEESMGGIEYVDKLADADARMAFFDMDL